MVGLSPTPTPKRRLFPKAFGAMGGSSRRNGLRDSSGRARTHHIGLCEVTQSASEMVIFIQRKRWTGLEDEV